MDSLDAPRHKERSLTLEDKNNWCKHLSWPRPRISCEQARSTKWTDWITIFKHNAWAKSKCGNPAMLSCRHPTSNKRNYFLGHGKPSSQQTIIEMYGFDSKSHSSMPKASQCFTTQPHFDSVSSVNTPASSTINITSAAYTVMWTLQKAVWETLVNIIWTLQVTKQNTV